MSPAKPESRKRRKVNHDASSPPAPSPVDNTILLLENLNMHISSQSKDDIDASVQELLKDLRPGRGLLGTQQEEEALYADKEPMEDHLMTGDVVQLPGEASGLLKFIGPLQGREGVYAGVQMSSHFLHLGKNSGDYNG